MTPNAALVPRHHTALAEGQERLCARTRATPLHPLLPHRRSASVLPFRPSTGPKMSVSAERDTSRSMTVTCRQAGAVLFVVATPAIQVALLLVVVPVRRLHRQIGERSKNTCSRNN